MSVGYFLSPRFKDEEWRKYHDLIQGFKSQLDQPPCQKIGRIAIPIFQASKKTVNIQKMTFQNKLGAFVEKIDDFIRVSIKVWQEGIEGIELKENESYDEILIDIKNRIILDLEHFASEDFTEEQIISSNIKGLIHEKTEKFPNLLNQAIVLHRKQCLFQSQSKKVFDKTVIDLKTHFPGTDIKEFMDSYEKIYIGYLGTESQRPIFVRFKDFKNSLEDIIDKLRNTMLIEEAILLLDDIIKKKPEILQDREMIITLLVDKVNTQYIKNSLKIFHIIETIIEEIALKNLNFIFDKTVQELD